jgi:hypothetical protein
MTHTQGLFEGIRYFLLFLSNNRCVKEIFIINVLVYVDKVFFIQTIGKQQQINLNKSISAVKSVCHVVF